MPTRSKTPNRAQTADKEAKANTELAEPFKNELGAPQQEGFIITPDDLDIPWMNIVQKSSTSVEGEFGELLLDKVNHLADPEEYIEVIPLTPRKGWKENMPYDEGQGRAVYNAAAAEELAADSEYDIIDFGECPFMIPQPKGNKDAGTYPFPIAGTNYALGKIHVAKEGFRLVYQRLATFEIYNRANGVSISHKTWKFRTRFTERGKYKYFVPELTLTGEDINPELKEFLDQWN